MYHSLQAKAASLSVETYESYLEVLQHLKALLVSAIQHYPHKTEDNTVNIVSELQCASSTGSDEAKSKEAYKESRSS
ncbi:hypothetical protein PBY51_007255 [Eleginops maclovinus]|uniref:Uncharacterized protein n=1 Tax=Eleginops maclovinus TaxID=56733 RepID=A0AAN7X6U9_ELEMC|nr:hypothetical protein PBY51_007255 [Eleginops maclovinus]